MCELYYALRSLLHARNFCVYYKWLSCANDPGRIGTCNPLLRGPMPYQLGHGAVVSCSAALRGFQLLPSAFLFVSVGGSRLAFGSFLAVSCCTWFAVVCFHSSVVRVSAFYRGLVWACIGFPVLVCYCLVTGVCLARCDFHVLKILIARLDFTLQRVWRSMRLFAGWPPSGSAAVRSVRSVHLF